MTNEMTMTSFTCVALIKPRGALAIAWKLAKPTYCIFEQSAAFGTREIRFGDGSWQELMPEQLGDLVLIKQLGEDAIASLFDC